MNNLTYQEHLLQQLLICENVPIHDDTCNVPMYQAVVEIPSIPAPVSPVDEGSTGAMLLAGLVAVLMWRKLHG